MIPQLWLRNTWSWGRDRRRSVDPATVTSDPDRRRARGRRSASTGSSATSTSRRRATPEVLFCDNETNAVELFGASSNGSRYTKDGIDDYVVDGTAGRGQPGARGHEGRVPVPRSTSSSRAPPSESHCGSRRRHRAGRDVRSRRSTRCSRTVAAEADEFYATVIHPGLSAADQPRGPPRLRRAAVGQAALPLRRRPVARGRPGRSPTPPARGDYGRRNTHWNHLSPWPTSSRCPTSGSTRGSRRGTWPSTPSRSRTSTRTFAKEQLVLMCREWAMHPNGQLPAYEWEFGDVNPPVHAWAAWHVYRIDGYRDREFLVRVFTKLLLNFSWWVNRKDSNGSNLFEGGFLGMDNIGLFNRSGAAAAGVPAGAVRRHQLDGVLLPADVQDRPRALPSRQGVGRHRHQVPRALPVDREGHDVVRLAQHRRCGTTRTASSTTSSSGPTRRRRTCGCGRWSGCCRSSAPPRSRAGSPRSART